jgi:hypothetical protein
MVKILNFLKSRFIRGHHDTRHNDFQNNDTEHKSYLASSVSKLSVVLNIVMLIVVAPLNELKQRHLNFF